MAMLARKSRNSFTLIEMLMVVIVILILSGILLKVIALVSRMAAESRATADMQRIQNALHEYYVEYGKFPPVNGTRYEYECTNYQSGYFRTFLQTHNNPVAPDFFADAEQRQVQPGWHLNYQYGLCSHLYRRRQGAQVHWFDADTTRDEAAKDRWNHYIAGLESRGPSGPHSVMGLQSTVVYSNTVMRLPDVWGNDYEYQCPPPYVRYRLWSRGADGVSGTADDVHADLGQGN